jgi:hypothetical protein
VAILQTSDEDDSAQGVAQCCPEKISADARHLYACAGDSTSEDLDGAQDHTVEARKADRRRHQPDQHDLTDRIATGDHEPGKQAHQLAGQNPTEDDGLCWVICHAMGDLAENTRVDHSERRADQLGARDQIP